MITSSKYPQHEKIAAMRSELDAVGDFYEFLQSESIALVTVSRDGDMLHAPTIEHLLAQWIEVDEDALEAEKRTMLAELRETNEKLDQQKED